MSNEFVVIQNKAGEEYAVREQDFERNADGQYDGFKAVRDEFGQPLKKSEAPKPQPQAAEKAKT